MRNCHWVLSEVLELPEGTIFTAETIPTMLDSIKRRDSDNIKEAVFDILNDMMTRQATTHAQLHRLERLVHKIGTELFARFLTGFIYQQKRR